MGFRKKTMKCVLLLSMLIALSASAPIDDGNETRADRMARYRLPNNTIPRLYNINLEPNMDDVIFTWTGKTSIEVEVVAPTTVMTLHAYKNLMIDESFTTLVDANGTNLTPVEHSRDDEVEFLKIKFDHEIPIGNHSLRLKFEGVDTTSTIGFYKASGGVEENMTVAGTHFEATTARRAFPCWDEPALKARFRLSVKHFSNYTVVSNMPEIERVETSSGKILTTFDTTPIMSTYLLTFVIANYQSVYNENRNVSLHAPMDNLEQFRQLLDVSPEVIRAMESYTGLSYGMPRIGSVVLPRYSAAATEHWGLVSYFDRAIAYDRRTGGTVEADRTQMLIAHELSHSWFGNRVTPLWWDDLWLNEGFAAYFQYYIMDKIYENWHGVDLFIMRNNYEAAFLADEEPLVSTKWLPIDTKEIRYVFGPSSYRKGSSIVHMFRNVIGDDAFRAGIQKFMARFSFKAAEAEDLMAALQEAYNEGPDKERPLDVKTTLMSWLVQKGHPVVNVTRNYTTGETTVSQKSVIIDSPNKWWVPLTYATKSRPNFTSTLPTRWISDKEDHVKIDGIDKDDWILLNVQASGFYRVNYDDENWSRLADYLNTDDYKNIHVLNRAQLLSDAFYLARREPRRYMRHFYKLTKYLSREDEYLPWRAVLYASRQGIMELLDTRLNVDFSRHFVRLAQKFIEKVGFEGPDTDDHFSKLARTDVFRWICISGHSGCAEYGAAKLIALANNSTTLHPDTKDWTFCAGLRGLNETAGLKFVEWAWDHYKTDVTNNLPCVNNHVVQRAIMNKQLTDKITEVEITDFVLREFLAASEENFNTAVDFFLDKHQAINNSNAEETVSRIVRLICDAVDSSARLEKFKPVLQLDTVTGNSEISVTETLTRAEENAIRPKENNHLFGKLWHELLSGDNVISGAKMDPR